MIWIGNEIVQSTDPILSTPGLFAYWTAESAVVSAAGNTIRLIDRSGNNVTARDLVQVTTGPTFNAVDANFNYKPSVSSSSANIRMQSTFDTSLSQPFTVYLVMRVETNAATVFWRTNAGNFSNSAGFFINSGPGTCTTQVLDGGQAITSVGSVTTGNKVSCCTYNGNSSAIYFNDSQTAFAAAPGQGSLDANGCAVMTIGNFGTGNVYSWTTMACYSGAHTAVQRKRIMQFLGFKYNIITT